MFKFLKILNSKIKLGLIFFTLIFVLVITRSPIHLEAQAVESNQQWSIEELILPTLEEPLMPGRIEGIGTHFEINDSEYMNVILDSSELIKLRMESAPEMITMRIESVSPITSTLITLAGLPPLTTLYKYQDDYHNLTEIFTNEQGEYTYTQDITKPHFIFIQPRGSTKFIKDDPSGGDCSSIGAWNQENKTCTLTSNLGETIQIDSDFIILDCNHYLIKGLRTGFGVYGWGKQGVTVKNCKVNNFYGGIHFDDSRDNFILNNETSFNTNHGICLDHSDKHRIKDNTTSDNTYEGLIILQSGENVIENNSFSNENQGICFHSSSNNIITNNTVSASEYTGIMLAEGSNNNTIINNTVSNSNEGIHLEGSEDNLIVDNKTFSNTNFGIYFNYSDNNKIEDNITLDNKWTGLIFVQSNGNIIENNSFSSKNTGISFRSSSNNSLVNNSVVGEWFGITLMDASNSNTITNNTVSNSKLAGIILETSSNNKIYHNNLLNNQYQAGTYQGVNNLFDNGYPDGGCFWSDYTGLDLYSGPNQDQLGSDGIGDIPYASYFCSPDKCYSMQDRYPFMRENGWEIIPDLGFRADPDGFKFKNFCTKYFDEELNKDVSRTWEMFKQFFGTEATMVGDVRRYNAEQFFDTEYGKYNPGQCGSCDGFSGTSLINFKHLDQPNAGPFAMPYYDNLYIQDLNDDIKDAIAYQQGFQFGLNSISYVTALKEESNNSPKFFYEKIKEAIQNKEPVMLWVQEKPKWWEMWKEGGAHALVPYRYEEDSSGNKANVYVYDSNYPGDDNRKIIFNLKDDEWSYKFQKGWWIFGETWTGDAYVSYQTIATVPLSMRLDKGMPPWAQEVPPFAYICSAKEIVDTLFTDQEGRRIGFAEGLFINEIPGANYITPLTQTQDKILGFYYLPEENDYTITLHGIDEGTADFRAFGNGLLIEITDATVHPTTLDNINIGRGEKSLTYSTNDDYKEYSATLAQELPETSRSIKVDTNISVGDITTLEITDEQTFKYVNTGGTKTYDFLLEQRGVKAGQASSPHLTIEENDTHIIEVADWSDLSNTAINAKIDEDSDGTIDKIERLQIIPRQLKEEIKTSLKEAKIGNELIDKKIDLIAKHIEKSLENKFWIDDFRLDPKYGMEVFHEEFMAGTHVEYWVKLFEKTIPNLEKIIERKQKRGLDTSEEESELNAIKSIFPVFTQAVYDLAKADEKLVEVAINDAQNTPVKNPKFQELVDHQIEKAEKELSKAEEELAKNQTAKAIAGFSKAWLHAQFAIKFAKLNN